VTAPAFVISLPIPAGLSEEQAVALARRMHVLSQLPTRLDQVVGERTVHLTSFPKEGA
jgi:hypothetical protein